MQSPQEKFVTDIPREVKIQKITIWLCIGAQTPQTPLLLKKSTPPKYGMFRRK